MKRLKRWLRKLFNVDLDFVGALRMTPGDVLVLKCSNELSQGQQDNIRNQIFEAVGGRNNVIVLDSQWTMEIIKGYNEAPNVVQE